MGVPEAGEIDIHHRVAVEHCKTFREQIEAGQHGSCGAERFGFDDITDAHAPAAAVAEMFLDQVGSITNEEDEVSKAMFAGEDHLMFEQGLSADGNHRLGKIAEAFFEPGPLPAGENDGLLHVCASADRIASGQVAEKS